MRSSSAGSPRATRPAPPPRVSDVHWALAIAAMLAVVAVVFVARPFLRDPSPASDRLDELAPEAQKRLALAEERGRALAALKELQVDHRTGKGSDEDYLAPVGPLRTRASGGC